MPAAFAAKTRSPTLTSEIAHTSPHSRVTLSDPAKQDLVCVKLWVLRAFVGDWLKSGEIPFLREGDAEGNVLDLLLGLSVNAPVGTAVGVTVGTALGVTVGVTVGIALDVTVRAALGVTVGTALGVTVGPALGVTVGTALGSVGVTVGNALGAIDDV